MPRERIYHQRFSVDFDFPVIFTRDIFGANFSAFLDAASPSGEKRRQRVLIFVDREVDTHHPGLKKRIRASFDRHAERLDAVKPPHVVPGGEAIKNDYRLTMEIVDTILEYRLCRHSCVVAIGGGAVLDAVGFAASIVHRGLRMIRLPTTVLSQNDGGIGVKNGMNLHGGKNTIGTFHPPYAVINDFDFLATLPFREWIAGVSEAFKVAVIKDAEFFRYLCAHGSDLKYRNQRIMEEVIVRCADLHLEHIRSNGDPFELGRARPLDFGHWAAHKLESMSNYRVGHGEAVAVGLALDSLYATEHGWLAPEDTGALIAGLQETGFRLWHEEMDRRLGDGTPELFGGLDDFQEHLGGELCITFPLGIGRKHEVHEVNRKVMRRSLLHLKSTASEYGCRRM